jgi:hypothetical protein
VNWDHRREIVAAKIGDMITTDRRHIQSALELNQDIQFIDRLHMEFMASFDLGPQWEQLAKAPTIFRLDKDGNPVPPSSASEEQR